jgi:tRNA(His) 5'-end guanylyltransferase
MTGAPLDDRMKKYEDCYRYSIPDNLPVIIRVDGRAFHTYTRGLDEPFDNDLVTLMNEVGLALCMEISGARMAYLQSDEVSVLAYSGVFSQPWFDNNVQKLASISASVATKAAAQYLDRAWQAEDERCAKFKSLPVFDARAFVIPAKEVVNYFVWRQRDWERNSVQMMARSLYSHKQLHEKNNAEMQELIHAKGQNWNDLPVHLRRGRCATGIVRTVEMDNEHFKGPVKRRVWEIDHSPPIFSKDRDYIDKLLRGVDETEEILSLGAAGA